MRRSMMMLALGLATMHGTARASDPVALEAVPPAVMEAVQKELPGGKFKKAVKDAGESKRSYVVTLTCSDGFDVDVHATPTGSVEQTIKKIGLMRFEAVPKPVLESIMAKYPKAYFRKAEEVRHEGRVSYRLPLMLEGKPIFSVFLDANGTILKDMSEAAK